MKKLFNFRLHSSNNANDNQHCSSSTDKQVSWEKSAEKSNKSMKKKHSPKDQLTPQLRRSLSFSGSPCDPEQYLPCYQTLTPERQTQRRHVDLRARSDTSEISSNCSTHVLDLYIDDGDQQMERCGSKTNIPSNNQFESGNVVVKRPPRFHSGSCDARSQKPKSLSSRQAKTSLFHLPSKETGNVEYIDSPRKFAKHAVKRLSQPNTKSREVHPDAVPITIEDVYRRRTRNRFGEDTDVEMDIDLELLSKFKEAEEQAELLSQELASGNFLQLGELSVPAMVQTVRRLTEDKLNMAIDVSSILQDRIAELALFREQLKTVRSEHESRTRRLEQEKHELQLSLEKELDRRSTEWSLKLEKYNAEEQMLRERVRELAEQNVNLQREVCSYNEREKDTVTKVTKSEKQLGEMSVQVDDAMEENRYLHKTLSELTESSRGAEEERDCVRQNYEEKVSECKDMHQAITRLQRTCNDQEKTIAGLRELCEELGRKKNSDHGLEKLKIEHMRLTRVEHSLRKEVESYTVQMNSLRQENIDLLSHMKHLGASSAFKLDQELQNRITCLQNQMLPLLTENSQLGRRLLDFAKTNPVKNDKLVIECEVKIQGLQRAAENLSIGIGTMSNVFQEKLSVLTGKCHSTGMDWRDRNEQKSEDIIRSELKAEMLLTKLLRNKLYSKEQETEQLQAEVAAAIRGNDILKSQLQNAVDEISCTNHKMKEIEIRLMRKEETTNELQECKKEVSIVKGVLAKVSEERDMMWEKVKKYSEDNMLLSREVSELKKKIEAMDDDILLKEGQISILRDSMNKPFDLLAIADSTDNKKLVMEGYS